MKIAYDPKCSLDTDEWISLSKPAQVFAQCYNPVYDQLVPVIPVTSDQILLAHDPAYVEGLFEGTHPNGFHDPRPQVLDQVLWANGALVAAAGEALKGGVCWAPVSGFHHARYGRGGGFCTLNGLVIAALHHRVRRTLIIDGDGHYGDGTDDIIKKLHLEDNITNLTHGQGLPRDGEKALTVIETYLRSQHWDLVIYQAGADSHKDDAFGSGYLTDGQWYRRDELVFSYCKRTATPIVWNLAGGYSGVRTINLHTATFELASAVFDGLERGRQGRPAGTQAAPRQPGQPPVPRHGWPGEGL